MRLEAVTAEIRPRSDWEAVDLGLALVRRNFWRCFTVWWLALALPTIATSWVFWDSPFLWLLLFWWCRPMGSRMVLFELSRRLFGECPAWRTSLREIPRVWTRRFFHRFVANRLSPWSLVTMAVEDLEGLRGVLYRQRCAQVTRRGGGPVMWFFFTSIPVACWFGFAIFGLLLIFVPEGQDGAWRTAFESWDPAQPFEVPVLIMRTMVSCVMLAVSLTDTFVMGAGFGIYLNNRTWIEGWDVELSLRRLTSRLTKVALVALLALTLFAPAHASAEGESKAAQVIREVKAAPEFKVQTVKERIRKPSEKNPLFNLNLDWLHFDGAWLEFLGRAMVVFAFVILIGLVSWLLYANRHVLFRIGGGGKAIARSRARVVMGMEVSPESLPADLPVVALNLWSQGKHQEALGLLYRGAISRVMDAGRVEIQESDTEGDCVRRVDHAGLAAYPEYFRGITGVWMRLAYAGNCPDDDEIELLCSQWPFSERKGA